MLPPPSQFEREVVMNIGLASAAPDYEFLFSATVLWRPTREIELRHHANPAALAVASIIERAEAVTSQEPPHRYTVALHRLNGVLGAVLTDRYGAVETWAGQVQLTLAEGDLARLQKLADARKEEEIWEYERHQEQNKRAYYAKDVFKDPGSALVWWLTHRDDDVDVKGAVELIGTLAQLSAAANNTSVPELLPTLLSLEAGDAAATPAAAQPDALAAIRDLLASLELDDGQRAVFVRRLIRAAELAGRPAVALDIQDTFEPADPSASDPLPSDPLPSDPSASGPPPSGPPPSDPPVASVLAPEPVAAEQPPEEPVAADQNGRPEPAGEPPVDSTAWDESGVDGR